MNDTPAEDIAILLSRILVYNRECVEMPLHRMRESEGDICDWALRRGLLETRTLFQTADDRPIVHVAEPTLSIIRQKRDEIWLRLYCGESWAAVRREVAEDWQALAGWYWAVNDLL